MHYEVQQWCAFLHSLVLLVFEWTKTKVLTLPWEVDICGNVEPSFFVWRTVDVIIVLLNRRCRQSLNTKPWWVEALTGKGVKVIEQESVDGRSRSGLNPETIFGCDLLLSDQLLLHHQRSIHTKVTWWQLSRFHLMKDPEWARKWNPMSDFFSSNCCFDDPEWSFILDSSAGSLTDRVRPNIRRTVLFDSRPRSCYIPL